MTTLTQTPRPGEYLMDDVDHNRTHDQVTIAASQTLLAGTVLGRISVGTNATLAVAAGANTGNGVLTPNATPVLPTAQAGAYRLVFIEPVTNLGTFLLEGPDGKVVGQGVVGTAFSNQLQFTIADGATDFVAGDSFVLTVTGGTTAGQFGALDLAATDGRAVAAGVLFSPITTGAGVTARGVVTRRSRRVNGRRLTWPAGFTNTQIATATDQLAAIGIIVRN